MDQRTASRQRRKKRSHDLAYVLGEGASVGRSRVVQDALSIAPLVLLNSALVFVIYLAVIARGTVPSWGAFSIVGPLLAALPLAIGFVLVSLRDHEQPVTVAIFVTGVAVSVLVSLLSASRVFMSYSGVLICAVLTALVMMAVMMRLQRAQSERVAMLDFPGAEQAVARLGGNIPIVSGAAEDLGRFDRFLVDAATHHSPIWSKFLLRSSMRGVLMTPWVQFLEKRRGRVDIHSFDPSDIVLRPSQILYSRVKRLLDLAGVLVALPFALVIGLAVALYIFVRAGRPVLFLQKRRGYGGESFTIVKFRTMQHSTAKHSALDNDKRIIPGLRLVRRLRLDEIPQIYNIWRGEMSWIGPRPAAVEVAEATEAVEPKYASRLLVRPGLTGWAQVNSGYASTVAEEVDKLGHDLYYVKHMSFDLDLVIMAKTIRILLFRIGAK